MPSVPLPFVTALLLVILFVRLFRQEEPTLRSSTVFVGTCAVLSVVVGLRWTFDIQGFHFIQPIVAVLLPAGAWTAFAQLADRDMPRSKWVHATPIAVVIVLSATWMQLHPPIDLVLALIFFGYGIAFLRLSLNGQVTFGAARLTDAPTARNAVCLVGVSLILIGIIDILLAGDFGLYKGAHSPLIVATANRVMLPVIAYAIATVGLSAAPTDVMESVEEASIRSLFPKLPNTNDIDTLSTIDQMMREKKLFRDPDLTLNRLARRALIPARQISAAINSILGKNVSQAVNDYRIEDAKTLLMKSDLSITSIVFEVGFHTKSNFNREFMRVTGMTPSDFRERYGLHPDVFTVNASARNGKTRSMI